VIYLSKNYFNIFISAALFLLAVSTIYAQSVTKESDKHYKITYWTADDGLPGNACVKIFQDSEGFLWIGGFDGLVRFDGARFTVFSKNNLLTSNFALAVVGDKKGNVWIGTDRGILHYKNGTLSNLSDKNFDFYVESLFFDEAAQKLWVGSRNAGLYTYDLLKHQYTFIDGPKNDDIINDIVKDKEGAMWVASEKNGLMRCEKGKWTAFSEKDGLLSTEIESLNLTKDGTLYVGTTSGLFIYRSGEKISEVQKFKGIRINKVINDNLNNLWVGTVNGLYHEVAKDDWRFLSREDGLSNNDIRDIFIDDDGSIWLGTYRGGVNQLRETKFANYFTNPEQRIEAAGALCQLNDNTLVVGSTEGKLFTIQHGEIKPYKLKTPIHQRIYTLLRDDKKNIWVASYDGLLLITPDGREKLFTEKDGVLTKQVRIIFQDKKGNYWIGTRNSGLIKMTVDGNPERPRFQQYMHEELSKVNSTFIMEIGEDSKGNLLLCTNNGGLTIISPQGALTNYNKKNGLENNTCFAVREDKQGAVWITTTDGLTRLKDGKTFTFTRKAGMPHENPMDVIEDDLGFFWLPTQKGTIRVSKQQLNDYADHKIDAIEWKLFDKNNDLEKSECTGTARSLKDAKGIIWIPMIGGLTSVDPSTIQISKKAPRIYIDKVAIDETEVDNNKNIVVPSTSHRVSFDYVALTLLYPNSARYKSRLNNFDKDWINAGSARQAVYTNLPHGQYSFSVMVSNNDGVWSTTSTNVSIVVEPHFYQTWWFITMAFVGSLSAVGIYIRVRTKAIKQRSVYLEKLVKERTKLIEKQRDELVSLNQDLRLSQDEVMSQRDSLADKIRELAEKNDEIENINSNLEKIVEMRTKTLEDQNKRISEYSFINAHNLRGPLASILGLINLITKETDAESRQKLNHHLLKSAEALDDVVRSINRMLEKEFKEDMNISQKAEPLKKEESKSDF